MYENDIKNRGNKLRWSLHNTKCKAWIFVVYENQNIICNVLIFIVQRNYQNIKMYSTCLVVFFRKFKNDQKEIN